MLRSRPQLELLEDRVCPDSYMANGLSDQLTSWQWLNPATQLFQNAVQLPGVLDNVSVQPQQTLTVNQNSAWRSLSAGPQTVLDLTANLTITGPVLLSGRVELSAGNLTLQSTVVLGSGASRVFIVGSQDEVPSGTLTLGPQAVGFCINAEITVPMVVQGLLTVRGVGLSETDLTVAAGGRLVLETGSIVGSWIANYGTITVQPPNANGVFASPTINNFDAGRIVVVRGMLTTPTSVEIGMNAEEEVATPADDAWLDWAEADGLENLAQLQTEYSWYVPS